jgi:hypothetical protein
MNEDGRGYPMHSGTEMSSDRALLKHRRAKTLEMTRARTGCGAGQGSASSSVLRQHGLARGIG